MNLAWFHDLSIRAKLIWLVLFTSSVALVTAGAVFIIYDSISFRQQKLNDLSTQAEILALTTAAALEFNDPRAAQEYLVSLKARPEIVSAIIYDAAGDPFATYAGRNTSRLNLPVIEAEGHRFESDDLLLFHRIWQDRQVIGTVYLRASLDQHMRQLRYAGIVMAVLMVSFLIAILLSSKLQSLISAPLLAVTQVARAVVDRHDYSERVNKTSKDEVGLLVDAFNEMLARIEQREGELKTANQTLQSEVAERIKTQEVLARNAELLNRTAELAKVGGWEIDLVAQKLILSEEVYRIYEMDPASEITLEEGISFYPPEAKPVIEAAVHAAATYGTPWDLELPLNTAKGNRVWTRSQGRAILQGGKAVRLVGAFQDITELRKSQAQLKLLESSVSRLNDIVLIMEVVPTDGADLPIVFVNDAFERHTGYSRGEAMGKTAGMLTGPGTEPAVLTRIRESMEQWQPVRAELIAYTKRGTELWLEVDIVPIADAKGRFTHWVSVMRDTTERHKADEARVSLESQLRESQKMEAIGTLAGGIAHDFNNILGAILGNVELANQDALENPAILDSLDEIRRAALRAKDLVQQILSFSRREPTQRRVMTLGTIVEESIRLLRATLPAKVSIDYRVAAETPAVLADPTQIQQIILNLGTNASHAMRGLPGLITVRLDTVTFNAESARIHADLRAGHYVCIAVSDTGHGMDAATLERMFEPFFTTKPVGEGTGLGLSVVHGIMRDHEGVITVQSQLGEGSTFTLYFPAVTAEIATEAATAWKAAAAPVPGKGQHILYIDDDKALLQMVKRMLERRGYRVTSHVNARNALELLSADPSQFDLVLTDYNMPVMSGVDVTREVRRISPTLPVAIASGYITDELRTQAAAVGVSDLVFKPNTVIELCAVVQRLLQVE